MDSNVEMRPIPGFPGYQVTSDGRVWSDVSGKFLKTSPDARGYFQVNLYREKRPTHILVHTLVLIAFVGPRPSGMECRHLNDNPQDNGLDNLRWGTRKENIADSIRNGHFAFIKSERGSKHPRATISEKQVAEIRMRYVPRVVTAPMLAEEYKTTTSVIYNVVHRTNWKHVA